MRRMTITEGLAELKLLDDRIKKAVSKDYIWSGKKTEITEAAKEEHGRIAKANYASAKDLIENRNAIKAAIVKSNATTVLTIGGKDMTVAEAIERKSSIEYDKMLRDEFIRQYKNAERTANTANERVQERIDAMLERVAASGNPDIETAQKVMSEAYLANNGWDIVDPLDLMEKVNALDIEIAEFEKNVDIALSMSNAVTFIEV